MVQTYCTYVVWTTSWSVSAAWNKFLSPNSGAAHQIQCCRCRKQNNHFRLASFQAEDQIDHDLFPQGAGLDDSISIYFDSASNYHEASAMFIRYGNGSAGNGAWRRILFTQKASSPWAQKNKRTELEGEPRQERQGFPHGR